MSPQLRFFKDVQYLMGIALIVAPTMLDERALRRDVPIKLRLFWSRGTDGYYEIVCRQILSED